jgi:hypothetical protein
VDHRYRDDVNDVMLWALLRQKLPFVEICYPYIQWHTFLYETIHEVKLYRLNLLLAPKNNRDSRNYLEELFNYSVEHAK